jgi:Icc-related predicted phosphoesterase
MNNFLHVPDSIVGIAGDWHGNTGWAKNAIAAFKKANIKHIFHLGDFGIWGGQDGSVYIRKINKWLTQNDQTLYVTLGNHEDYVRVENTPEAEDGTKWYNGNERIKLLPRGFRGTVGSNHQTWVSLGGANSIDYKNRTEWLDWWRAESITMSDVYTTINNGYSHYMFCHDAPTGVSFQYEDKSSAAGWNEDAVRYSDAGRQMLKHAVDGVKPKILFHGHHHTFQDETHIFTTEEANTEYKLRTIGLARDEMDNNIIALNTSDDSYIILKV